MDIFEISFSEKINQIKKAVTVAVPAVQENLPRRKQLAMMASLSPVAAVSESWDEVVSVTSQLMVKHVPERILNEDTLYRQLEKLLIEYDLADEKQVRFFHDLRILRNKMVPEYGITSLQAAEFADLALSLSEYLSTLKE
jgi:hypothetical protein